MANLKVLPLEPWVKYDIACGCKLLGSENHPKVTVVAGRPGYYFVSSYAAHFCWIEAKVDGVFKAWLADPNQWLYDYEVLCAKELNHRQVAALQAVVREGLATKEQRKLFIRCKDAIAARHIGRHFKKSYLKLFRRKLEASK